MRKYIVLILILLATTGICGEIPSTEVARLVEESAKGYGIPKNLLLAVLFVESNLRHFRNGKVIRGMAGEIGIGQLMPATAKSLGVDPWSLEGNIKGAAKFLSIAYTKTGSIFKTACFYNSGRLKRIPKGSIRYAKKVLKVYGRLK